MKTYEIYEIANKENKITVTGKNFADACKNAKIAKPNRYKVVSWAYVEEN